MKSFGYESLDISDVLSRFQKRYADCMEQIAEFPHEMGLLLGYPVEVIPEFDTSINVEIKDDDLKIDVYRSSGAGGQGVNTTDSAVRITHIPTKTVVTCQNERSQLKNKEQAMVVLKSKLYALEEQKKIEESEEYKKDQSSINFGSQIRSYVMHPYSMVKDHRTNYETSNVSKVLDGDLDMFIEEYLRS